MRFDASEEQQQLAVITRRFLEDTAPLTTVRLLGEKSPAGFDREWWRRAADLGWTSLLVPEHLGGSSTSGAGVAGVAGVAGLADLAIVAEERGRLVSPGPFLPTSVAAWTLAVSDQPDEFRTTLDAIVSGDTVCVWVRGESGGGSAGLAAGVGAPPPVAATRRGEGWELNGTARAVEAGADGDSLLVAAHYEGPVGQVGQVGQVVHLLVPAGAEGLHRERAGSLDLVRRHADLRFDGVVLPPSATVIGTERGQDILLRQTQIGNVLQCAEMVGAANRAFEMTLDYAGERCSFGRPLASYQVLKHRLADMKLWLEACQAAVEGAVDAVAGEAEAAAALVSTAKLYAGQKCTDIVQDCIQIHGGIGVTWEHDLHLYLRRVTTDRQLLGTPADHAQNLASLIGL